jgi:hypothetical protein
LKPDATKKDMHQLFKDLLSNYNTSIDKDFTALLKRGSNLTKQKMASNIECCTLLNIALEELRGNGHEIAMGVVENPSEVTALYN